MTTDYQEFLRDYLTAIQARHPAPTRGYEYASQADLLLQHGKWFASIGNYPGLPLGEMQFCFYNARKIVVARPQRFTYYEGYALSRTTGLPHPHAWVVDHNGLAWDVTWPVAQVRQNTALVGVRVSKPVLDAHWRTCGGASLLQDYYHDHPCLQVKYRDWNSLLISRLERLRQTHCLLEVAAGRMALLPDGSMTTMYTRDEL